MLGMEFGILIATWHVIKKLTVSKIEHIWGQQIATRTLNSHCILTYNISAPN